MDKPRERYHHGALRSALVAAGTELAREGGPEQVVLREVSRRAGVSHAAAYRHFADRDALLVDIAAHARAQLAAAMRRRIANHTDPRQRLRHVGAAYIDFALTENGLFRTAFMHHPLRDHSGTADHQPPAPDTAAAELDSDPYAVLTEVLDDAEAAGLLPTDRRAGAEIAAWSAVHGLAELLTSGPLLTNDPHATQSPIDRVLDSIEHSLIPNAGAKYLRHDGADLP